MEAVGPAPCVDSWPPNQVTVHGIQWYGPRNSAECGLTSRANHAYRNDMTAVRPRERKILYPPPSFQAVAGRLSCSTSPLAITSPGFNEAPIKADIVFLPDNRVCRKVTYRLYPTPTQEEGLWKRLRLHHILYNGALE
jgi:hypothetical protein